MNPLSKDSDYIMEYVEPGPVLDLAPVRTTNTPGDRFTLFESTQSDRARAASSFELAPLTESNLDLHKELLWECSWLDCHDALLHAAVPHSVTDDDDAREVGYDWDLPSATYCPTSEIVSGGLQSEQQGIIHLNPECVGIKHVLVNVSGSQAVYIFPMHGVIVFRGRYIWKSFILKEFSSYSSSAYPYEFDIRTLFGDVILHSNEPLPKIHFDYHIYTERFPQGFPSTGAQHSWCLDVVNPTDLIKPFTSIIPNFSWRKFIGSRFTIQPMSTLDATYPPHLATANARHQVHQCWVAKVRAGAHLMKLGHLNASVLLEDQPWRVGSQANASSGSPGKASGQSNLDVAVARTESPDGSKSGIRIPLPPTLTNTHSITRKPRRGWCRCI